MPTSQFVPMRAENRKRYSFCDWPGTTRTTSNEAGSSSCRTTLGCLRMRPYRLSATSFMQSRSTVVRAGWAGTNCPQFTASAAANRRSRLTVLVLRMAMPPSPDPMVRVVGVMVDPFSG